jgi:hypothetical protein
MEMRKIYNTAIVFFVLALMAGTPIMAQPETESGEALEKYVISTDRSLYISGEQIRFRIFNISSQSLKKLDWSSILYVELVTPRGDYLSRLKISIDSQGGYGSIQIPTSISSGTYYLKAYSREMRNCGPTNYSYRSIEIIDPFMKQVVPVDTSGPYTILPAFDEMAWNDQRAGPLTVQFDKEYSMPGEKVGFEIHLDPSIRDADVCVSVSRQGTHFLQTGYQGGCRIEASSDKSFLTEIRGISLSGQIISQQNNRPIPYATVYVSVLGDHRNFLCNYADSAGRFFISFPDYVGEKELFVSAYSETAQDLELLIDHDFSTEPVTLPSPPLLPGDFIKEVVRNLSINAQVAQQYYPVRENRSEDPGEQVKLFYGAPSNSIELDDYIKLPKLEEYFFELIPQVAIRKQRGERRLIIRGEQADMELYSPLLLIDGVAIFDVEALLAVSPRLIDRIEIVNAPYIRGNVIFGGIISVITRSDDLGYIDLPSSGLLVNYLFLQDNPEDQMIEVPEDPNLPDVRNTIFWDPSVRIVAGGSTAAEFILPDRPGLFEIVVTGYTDDGRLMKANNFIDVTGD